MSQSGRVALFIDGASLHAAAKALGFNVDFRKLLAEFQVRGRLLRAFYYISVFEDQEVSSTRPLIDWLSYNGYTVVTKVVKESGDGSGRRKMKSGLSTELAVTFLKCPGTSMKSCCLPVTEMFGPWWRRFNVTVSGSPLSLR